MIPHTLAEVAKQVTEGESFSFAHRNFLDGFYTRPSPDALAVEPPPLRNTVPDGKMLDAYLAASAEELSRAYSWSPPAWSFLAERVLDAPWFALQWTGMRTVLLLESPPGFRSRNLFVSANALTRI